MAKKWTKWVFWEKKLERALNWWYAFCYCVSQKWVHEKVLVYQTKYYFIHSIPAGPSSGKKLQSSFQILFKDVGQKTLQLSDESSQQYVIQQVCMRKKVEIKLFSQLSGYLSQLSWYYERKRIALFIKLTNTQWYSSTDSTQPFYALWSILQTTLNIFCRLRQMDWQMTWDSAKCCTLMQNVALCM